MKRLMAAGLVFLALAGAARAQAPQPFEFVALGDMPYNIPGDYEKFDRLIARINAVQPAFSLHVGDIISGRTTCSDEHFAKVKTQFDSFAGALVYTPGDNEWTDCHRLLSGSYDPLERLAAVRKLFFVPLGKSLGAQPIALEHQSQTMAPKFADYVENTRFAKNGVRFASVHVVGSLNNYDPSRPATVAEFEARNAANVAWIDETFRQAGREQAQGVVLFWQANTHAVPRRNPDADYAMPFHATIQAVERGARAFQKPVLVIFGDFHFYEIKPFLNLARQPVPGVIRLQVFGDGQVHAVRVKVDPADPALFSMTPLLVPENGLP